MFAVWQSRAVHPLLPPRVVLDRNRGGAYLTMLITGAGIFGIFLFLIYYMQGTLGYSPIKSGVALLPMVAVIGVMASGVVATSWRAQRSSAEELIAGIRAGRDARRRLGSPGRGFIGPPSVLTTLPMVPGA